MRKILKALLLMLSAVAIVFSFAACEAEPDVSEKTVVEAPVIQSKVYNGQAQSASIAASDDYVVTVNVGGTDVGEYDVVLTLKNTETTKWETSDADNEAKVTLKFAITKATNEITSFTLDGWTVGSEPNAPVAVAAFGTATFTYSAEENGTFTEEVPVSAGKYYVKATVAGTANYAEVEKVISFEIGKVASSVKTAPVACENLLVTEDLSAQTLITAGEANGGVMYYALVVGEEDEPSQDLTWATELPAASAAGKYTVYYMVKGDSDHSDSPMNKIVAEIAKRQNEISSFVVADIKYGETPEPSATAVNGTVDFSYSIDESGEFVAWNEIEKRAGKYFVKATVEAGDVYTGATAVKSFNVNKADNSIATFVIPGIKCHNAPELTATATAGTAITYKYATAQNGDYIDLTAETVFEAGTYYVKAYTAGNDNYVAAVSEAAELVVSHELVWDTTEEEQDTEKCVCGHTGRTFDKSINIKDAQRVNLNLTVEDGNVVTDEYAYAIVSISGISEYSSIEGIKFGSKDITQNAFVDESELTGNKIALNVKDFGKAYGEQNVVVTVACDGGDTHEVKVKVLLVSATFNTKSELNNFGTIAKACEEDATTWGGYFELGDDIDYQDYWSEFFGAANPSGLSAMNGFVGVFDGMGYNINDLRVTKKSATDNGAFISKLGVNGVLRNVSFTNAQVGNDRSLLVYSGSGLIENVFVKYAIFGANDWNEYSPAHNWGQTSTMFARGESSGAVVRNVIIDVSECVGVATQVNSVNGYIIGQCNNVETYSNVYVVGASEQYTSYLRNNAISAETKKETNFEAGTNYFAYKSFMEMAYDSERDYSEFKAPLWINKGGIPYVNAQVVTAPVFVTAASEIAKGSSAEFTVNGNAVITLSEAAIAAGITIVNGRVTVPEEIDEATFVLTATSIFDPTLRTETTFNVIKIREYKTISKFHEIDLDFANDGTANSSKTVEIDLTEYFSGDAAISAVKVGDEVLNGFDGVQIVGGKVTLNVSGFGSKYYGNQNLKIVFESEGKELEYTVPALFITKTIMNGDENVRAIKTLSDLFNGGGYYRLGENVKLSGGWLTNSGDDYRIGVNSPFIGTLDGQGYSISTLMLSGWTKGGFIQNLGASGVVKNIAFLDVRIGGAASLIYTGSGTIQDVYVKISMMPAAGSGTYTSAVWRGNEATVFGCRLETNSFVLKNVCVDYSAAGSDFSSYTDKPYAMLLGTFAENATLNNVVVTGMLSELSAKVTNSGAVYVAYTDDTNNGVAFPASDWNETYWTVGEYSVTWKAK